ncbi:MAG TPA: ankyrin repeat domain-containing protein [Chlamydiales bacterium]|nr:ankyrin repeat domain-containing protein [Chlamydiales bacterium]
MIAQKMSVISPNKSKEIPYYHREYKNDVKELSPEKEASWMDQAQRVGILALPFLSLYKPLSFPISLGMGGVRVLTNGSQLAQAIQAGESLSTISYQLFQVTISVVSLAGTIVAHPAGMIITTLHDLVIESGQLICYLQTGNYSKALESAATLFSNALYLAAIGGGGIELHIGSLAMQTLLGLYHGYTEGQKGNYLEMAAHIAMAGIRGKQLHDQCKIFQRQKEFEQIMLKRSKQAQEKTSTQQLPVMQKLGDLNTKDQIHAELKQLGFDPLNMPKSGNTALHQAVQKGNLRAVELALDYGFDISSQNNAGDTALHLAAAKGNLEIVQHLVQRGADIYIKNNLDQLAFHKGLKFDNIVSYFESLGYQREIPVREWAIVQGLRPDYVDSEWNTFLHRLVKMKHHEGLKYVIQEKFRLELLDMENEKHFRPIDLAIEQKDRGVLQIFITHFQDHYIHYKNLHQAAHVGWKEGLEMILPFYDQKAIVNPEESFRLQPEMGRYLDFRSTYPKNLLQEAVYSGDLDTVKLLVEYGCSINELNYNLGKRYLGKRQICYPIVSPLSLAEYFHPENRELFDYLQKLGAKEFLSDCRIISAGWTTILGHLLTMEQFFSPSPGPVPQDPIRTEGYWANQWDNFGKKSNQPKMPGLAESVFRPSNFSPNFN